MNCHRGLEDYVVLLQIRSLLCLERIPTCHQAPRGPVPGPVLRSGPRSARADRQTPEIQKEAIENFRPKPGALRGLRGR